MKWPELHRDQFARAAFWLAPGLAGGFAAEGRWPLALAALAGIHAPLVAGSLLASCRWFGPMVRQIDPAAGWLLTIDDGPDRRDTPALLKVLERHGLPALFFFVGQKAAANRSLVAEVVAAGHGVGGHTWSHPTGRWWCATKAQAREEIRRGQGILGEIVGEAPLWFRSPVGMSNPWVHAVVRELGLQQMGWTARGFDGSARPGLPQVLGSLERQIEARGRRGAIVVMHEGHHDRSYLAEDLMEQVILLMESKRRRE